MAATITFAAFVSANPAALPGAVAAKAVEKETEPAWFEPAESAREMIAAEDGGMVFDDEREPAQVVRLSSVERHAWANPATGAWVEVEVPREDVVLMPVAFQ